MKSITEEKIIMNKEMEDFKNSLETEEEKTLFDLACELHENTITPIEFFNKVIELAG